MPRGQPHQGHGPRSAPTRNFRIGQHICGGWGTVTDWEGAGEGCPGGDRMNVPDLPGLHVPMHF